MKKKMILVWACLMAAVIGCAGCGQTQQESRPAQESNQSQETGYVFEYKGTAIKMNADMAALLTALGEADSYFESPSCAFQGMDKVYTYGSIVITTYPEGGKDYVYTVELKDDLVKTPEGISIGSSRSAVTAAYGTPAQESDTSLVFRKDDSELTFIIDGDSVKNILYMAITK